MIPASTERRQTSANWPHEQAAGYRHPLELLAGLGLADELGPRLAGEQMLRQFPEQRAPGLLQKYAGVSRAVAPPILRPARSSHAD